MTQKHASSSLKYAGKILEVYIKLVGNAITQNIFIVCSFFFKKNCSTSLCFILQTYSYLPDLHKNRVTILDKYLTRANIEPKTVVVPLLCCK